MREHVQPEDREVLGAEPTFSVMNAVNWSIMAAIVR